MKITKPMCLCAALASAALAGGGWLAARRDPTDSAAAAGASAARRAQRDAGGVVHFDILQKLLADDRRASAPQWLHELAAARLPSQAHPLLGFAAPDFTLRAAQGRPWTLHDACRRGPVVLVFYLSYTCNACVHDLFELDADLERFHTLGAEVVAVSGDAPELTRRRFAQFGAFAYPVLSDDGHRVAQRYGIFRPATGSAGEELQHGTFVISRDGRVAWASYGSLPFRNHQALLAELAAVDEKHIATAVEEARP